ncbi:hypothetical protein RHGRI_004787 [Rhododendron griersonianum]|uniref:Peptidase M16 N-terminal domain-containing protein n=1 Tax=Rhododendron griersonianum TaxID=479676 RepID=A0AAV6LB52_9ERIC|nr:hypothetical protein RHGRI_004787 [Rhododendron griersonianum]
MGKEEGRQNHWKKAPTRCLTESPTLDERRRLQGHLSGKVFSSKDWKKTWGWGQIKSPRVVQIQFDALITSARQREVSSQHSYSGGSHPVFHPASRHLYRSVEPRWRMKQDWVRDVESGEDHTGSGEGRRSQARVAGVRRGSPEVCRGWTRAGSEVLRSVGTRYWIWKYAQIPWWVMKCGQVKQVHVPCATVGPDEPHTASTIMPGGVLEEQSLDSLNPEIERMELERLLSSKLPSHPKLYGGRLSNGLRYHILPNKLPANRFEAHVEVHVGSIDEDDDEQGIAHMIEHVAFLGSKKHRKLIGTGARSNAYTNFRNTDSGGDLLPPVLDVLNELSQHLHSENKLGKRLPIGLEEQIKKLDADMMRKFHERSYFPANATLYIVGDIDNISKSVYHIEAAFGQTGPGNETVTTSIPSAFRGNLSQDRSVISLEESKILQKERHAVR